MPTPRDTLPASGLKGHVFLTHAKVPYGLAETPRVGNVAKHSNLRREKNHLAKKQLQKEPLQKQGLWVAGPEL